MCTELIFGVWGPDLVSPCKKSHKRGLEKNNTECTLNIEPSSIYYVKCTTNKAPPTMGGTPRELSAIK